MTSASVAAGAWSAATLWVVFLVGLTGGFGHCIGMCGPLMAATAFASGAADETGSRARRPWRYAALVQLGYHGGRLFTYTLVGVALGALGGAGVLTGAIGPVRRWMWLAAGILMVVMGLAVIGAPLFGRASRVLESSVALASGGWFSRAYSRLAGAGPIAVVPLGMLTGLLPCGFLISMELVALSAGSALAGGATMLAFGVGTLPALVGFGTASGLLGSRARGVLLYAGGVLVVALGTYTVVRSLGVLTHIPSG